MGLKVANRFWTFLKMSILAKGRFSEPKNVEKKAGQTIMLSFPFFSEKCCDANFFKNILKNDLSVFLSVKYIEKWK